MTVRAVLGAAALYLAALLCAFRAVVPVATSAFPYPTYLDETSPRWKDTLYSDQKLSAALTAYNARTLVTRPDRIMEGPQCFPVANATTLGEHMIGPGLRGIVPWALTGDLVLTYNVVLLATHWIAAMAMYALVLYWTGAGPAALVAGLLFGLQPLRLTDTAHPYVYGLMWAPLALLFAHRLLARGRWRDALGLTLVVGLQLLEGAYPAVTLGLLGGVYGVVLLYRHRARLLARLPPLLACGAALGLLVTWLLGPYAETHALWSAGESRGKVLYAVSRYAPGAPGFPGMVLVALAVVALVDRVRRARAARGEDPRVVLLLAGAVTLWAAVDRLPVPGSDWSVPSLLVLLGDVIPGLGLIRVGGAIEAGVGLVGAVLAGYGVLVLVEHRRRAPAAILTTILVVAVLLEVLAPPLARVSFGRTPVLVPYHVRPPAALLALYDTIDDGAVLDIPLESRVRFSDLGQHVWLGAFHGQPVASCYNSFRTPVQTEIEALARRVHTETAAGDALYALGFRTVVVHVIVPGRRRPPPVVPLPPPPHLVKLGQTFTHAVYRLRSAAVVGERLALLAHVGVPAAAAAVAGAPRVIVPMTNHGAVTYRHPAPFVPTRVRARWYDGAEMLAREETRSVLLPLAMAAGDTVRRMLPFTVPEAPGRYRLTVAPVAQPDLLLVDAGVRVRRADAAP